MMIASFLKALLTSMLLPPGNGLFLLAVAAWFHRRQWAFKLAIFAGLLLLLQSLPPVAQLLIHTLEKRAGPVLENPGGAQAIVVLGSGLNANAPEYGGDTASHRSLVRLRYAAQLAHRYHLPVLITGGKPYHATHSEADIMADILEREYGIRAKWREGESSDTKANAQLSAKILHSAGVRRIILVTQAFHMPRSKYHFESVGFEVIPAPTNFMGNSESPYRLSDWLPQAQAMHASFYALHEYLGFAWLKLSGLWE